MSRAQAIVVRGNRILLVQHREAGASYWCLPGGGVEAGESPEAAVVRELFEECGVRGTVIRPTAVTTYAAGDQHFTFLIDIGDAEPTLGHDPEFGPTTQILMSVGWKTIAEVRPLDRVYLWTAGLLGAPGFLEEAQAIER